MQRLRKIIESKSNWLFLLPLVPLSSLWSAITFCRRWLYEKRYFFRYQTQARLISVGNITSGGTGKTPFIDLILSRLEGTQVGVVSRGYGSILPSDCVVGSGSTIFDLVDHDETKMLALHHPEALFALSHSKMKAAAAIETDVSVIILDDGFQHFKLARDVDIVVVHGENPFGNGYVLPRGILRESRKALKKASLVVVNYADSADLDSIRKVTDAPMLLCTPRIVGCFDRNGFLQSPQKVALVSAIGSPESFQKSVEQCGMQVVNRLDFPDHSHIDQKKLLEWVQTLPPVDAIVVTEKDWVRDKFVELPVPLLTARMKLHIIEGEEYLKEIL